ncbi:MAG: TatD family hydrolase [Methanobacteriaceae archaeon]|nr:TatD family hydrolase [Methanobacteriaceae archaeon]
MIIDAHLHADTRPYEDFQKMRMGNVIGAITCAHDPLKMEKSNVTLEHLHRIIYDEPKRAIKNDFKLFTAVGIHPRAIPQDYEVVLEKLKEFIFLDNVIAIGEIGLETTSQLEQEVFIKQLKLADELKSNIIVHTPRTNKAEVTNTTIKLINEYIDPKLVQLDHIDYSIINKVIDSEYNLAITVQPLKMSVNDTVKMLDKYGCDKFVVDSDLSSAPSDPLSLPKLLHSLRLNNFKQKDIDKITHKNIMKFHNINL